MQQHEYLVTGGTGSIGQHIVRTLLAADDRTLIRILSRNDCKQYEFVNTLGKDKKRVRCYGGDIRDYKSVKQAAYGVDTIIHTAALKHVVYGEQNVSEYASVNIHGTENLINIYNEYTTRQRFIHISTDKVCDPTSAMGASKLLAERLLLQYKRRHLNLSSMCILRLGNVWSSYGSVLPLWVKQMRADAPIVVTDWNVTRYVISSADISRSITRIIQQPCEWDLFVPTMQTFDLRTVFEAAKALAGKPDFNKIELTGLIAGEKLHETAITRAEMHNIVKMTDDGVYLSFDPRMPNRFEADIPLMLSSEVAPRISKEELLAYERAIVS